MLTYLHIPYKGSVQLSTDLIGGQVQVGILGFASFIPHIRSGKLKLLGISSSVKVSSWPDAQL
ncbi:MAG: tripartite tricarboxylate transporter substrate binding protein, partial [Polynucleobacter sp.]|nr:tripartite tricarboxylate transporter substrate binding protein [Polynucleobacter sp.]